MIKDIVRHVQFICTHFLNNKSISKNIIQSLNSTPSLADRILKCLANLTEQGR